MSIIYIANNSHHSAERFQIVLLTYSFLKCFQNMETSAKQKLVKQSSAVYGLGFIGSVIYFIQHATGFWMGVLGILKAIVWPAFIVYKLLEFLKM